MCECVGVLVCWCVRERESARASARARARVCECVRECVGVYTHIHNIKLLVKNLQVLIFPFFFFEMGSTSV